MRAFAAAAVCMTLATTATAAPTSEDPAKEAAEHTRVMAGSAFECVMGGIECDQKEARRILRAVCSDLSFGPGLRLYACGLASD